MFTIDTGDTGGSQGPWMRWTSEGSARKRLDPESWVLRDKDANGNKIEHNIPAFTAGCVMDLDSLQLGWEKEGAGAESRPERRWNPSVSQSTPRPDESKKAGGGYAWTQALSVRCAIGNGQAATWEQGGFGAYEAFTRLSKQIMAEWSAHSQNGKLLPLVMQAGVETKKLPNGNTSIPQLTIAKWVERPDCLKADAPVIAAAAPAPAPAPQPPYTPPPAMAASVPTEAQF
jgi:hypothetical protein